jgi:hypothetical protein
LKHVQRYFLCFFAILPVPPAALLLRFDPYSRYFHRTAAALNGCNSGRKPILSGPGWGNVNTIDAKWVAQMTKYDGMKCYMREMNVHVSLKEGVLVGRQEPPSEASPKGQMACSKLSTATPRLSS